MEATLVAAAKEKKSFVIKFIILIALIAVIWNLPPSGVLTKAGVHSLVCFFGVVYGLCFMKEYGVYNLLAIVLMGFSGAYTDMGSAFKAAFSDAMVYQMFAIMLFVGVISRTGLARVIALKMINAKFAAGKPWVLTLLIAVTSSVLATFMPCLVVIVVMSELIIEIFKGLGLKGNRWTMFVLMDLAVLTIMAQDIMPFQLGPIMYYALLSAYDSSAALSNFAAPYIVLRLLYQVLTILFCWGLTWFACRKDVEALKNYKPSEEKFKLNEEQRIAFVILCIFVFLQLFPLVLPQGSAIRTFLEKPSLVGCATIATILAMIVFKKNNKHFITFD